MPAIIQGLLHFLKSRNAGVIVVGLFFFVFYGVISSFFIRFERFELLARKFGPCVVWLNGVLAILN